MNTPNSNEEINYNYEGLPSSKIFLLKILLVFFIISILGVFAYDIYRAYKKGTYTKDMSQQEVIKHFYTSANKYDISAMQSCIDNSKVTVINNRILANTVFNTRRNMEENTHGGKQIQIEGKIYNPDKWINLGKPTLKKGEIVEGFNNIYISKINEITFKISYDYYNTNLSENGLPMPPVFTTYIDICIMIKKKGNWIISEIRPFIK